MKIYVYKQCFVIKIYQSLTTLDQFRTYKVGKVLIERQTVLHQVNNNNKKNFYMGGFIISELFHSQENLSIVSNVNSAKSTFLHKTVKSFIVTISRKSITHRRWL